MSKISCLILVLVFMLCMPIACQQKVPVAADKTAIQAVLESYITSIENEDMVLYAKILAHDPDMVNFGTDAVEYIVGWEALEKLINVQNAAWSETKITPHDVVIKMSPEGRFAWATSLWDVSVTISEQSIEVPHIRCTWILEKHQANWVIVHFHKSIGMAG